MKNLFRLGVMLALIVAVAAPLAAPARAQAPCLPGLEQADCDLMAAVEKNAANVKTAVIDEYALKLSVKGIPQSGDVDIDIKGAGAFDVTNVKPDPTKPESIIDGLALQLTAVGSANVQKQESKFDVEFRIVDGILYAKDPAGQWHAIDAKKAIGSMAGSMTGMTGSLTAGSGAMPDLSAIAAVPGLVKASASDADVSSVKARKITAVLDLGVLASPTNTEAITKALGPAGAQLGQVLPMFSALLKSTQIEISGYYGVETQQMHGLDVKLALKTDASLAMMNVPAGVELNFAFSFRLSKHNEPVTIEAVPDAKKEG